jgi:ABC-type polar amino acid transport system ATPase subunit
MEGANGMSAPVLDVRDLCLRRGARDVLRGVQLSVRQGEIVALMGLSGAGKSTVLRCIAALEPFNRGAITVAGATLEAGPQPSRSAERALRASVGMVFQHSSLFEHLTVAKNVWLAPVHVRRVPQADAERRARVLLDDLGVGHRADALPREISGGEAQRVAIARALAMDPPVLLMDEPTASLDPARRGELGDTLRQLTSAGRTLLVTTHDDDFVREFATTVAILADGVVVEAGDPRTVLSTPSHPATERLLQADRSPRRAT